MTLQVELFCKVCGPGGNAITVSVCTRVSVCVCERTVSVFVFVIPIDDRSSAAVIETLVLVSSFRSMTVWNKVGRQGAIDLMAV